MLLLRDLEARLGLQLFDRSSHHVELTLAAERLLPIARAAVATLEDAAATVTSSSGSGGTGVLRLAAPTYTIRLARRTRLLDAFATDHPHIHIAIDNDPTADLLPRLREGDLDAAFLLQPIDADGLTTMPFARRKWRLQIPAAHPLAASSTVTVTRLNGMGIATWRAGLHPGAWEDIYGPMRDAGAILVPMTGLVVDGIPEAASTLGLISLTTDETPPSPSIVLRAIDPPLTSQIVLAAPADRSLWSEELDAFWHAAESLVRTDTRRIT
jgi:DNA-binding transcriptional LysR family regulator